MQNGIVHNTRYDDSGKLMKQTSFKAWIILDTNYEGTRQSRLLSFKDSLVNLKK